MSGWSTAPGFATVLRVVGGIGLAVGIGGTMSLGRVQRVVRRPSVARSLSSAVLDDVQTQPTHVTTNVLWFGLKIVDRPALRTTQNKHDPRRLQGLI